MVTRLTPERWDKRIRAISAYLAQSHALRELIIVTDGCEPAAALTRVIAKLDRRDIRLVEVGRATLGSLRNLSVQHAAGEFVCQWDDDDLYHPDRLTEQLRALQESGADASVLQDIMAFDAAHGVLRWLNWAGTPAGGAPGTLMCRRRAIPRYPEVGPAASLGEDLAVLEMLSACRSAHRLALQPYLHIYVNHGANTWSAGHHSMLAERLSISKGLLERREGLLRAGLAAFGFSPQTLRVEGSNGLAFML